MHIIMGMPPHIIIIGMPFFIMFIMPSHMLVNISIDMPFIGFISQVMPVLVMVQVIMLMAIGIIPPIIGMGIGIILPIMPFIIGFIMLPIIGIMPFIIGFIMLPIIGIMLFIIGFIIGICMAAFILVIPLSERG